MSDLKKEYLSNGVYLENDGYNLILTTETEDGFRILNTIYIGPQSRKQLIKYMQRLWGSEDAST